MRQFKIVLLTLFCGPLLLMAQTWTYTPDVYPAVCTNAAIVGQWTMDFATATNRAALENKRIYLHFSGSTWCPDCDSLERLVMGKSAFEDFLKSSDAYWVWLDFPKRAITNATDGTWLCHTNTGFFSLSESENILARNRMLEQYYGAIKNYLNRLGTEANPYRLNMPTIVELNPDGSYQGEVTHYRTWTNVTAEAFVSKLNRVWNDDAWDVQDNAVPGKSDDSAATATALSNILESASQQEHTLSPTDTADWYTFAASPGATYTFAATGRLLSGQAEMPTGQITVELFTETNATAVAAATAAGALDESPTARWTLNQARSVTCYVRVSGNFASVAGYTLSYSSQTVSQPAAVQFGSTQVSVSETAASVSLNIALASPCVAEGGVRVFVSTVAPPDPVPFGTATPGQDYVAVVSNEVVWTQAEAIQQVTKQVTIPLVQDLRATWEGDETLAVALENGLNSDVVSTGSVATVVLKETSKRNSGTVGFVAQGASATPFANARKPTVVVREGDALILWVGRSGGSDGTVSATVETVAGSALPGVNFVSLSTNVVWSHGETNPCPVALSTLAMDAYNKDLTLKVRITQTTASGIASGAGMVTVTERDQAVAQTLSEAGTGALSFRSSGSASWFVGNGGEYRCESVSAGKTTTLKTSVTGPGRLQFDWTFLPNVQAANRLIVKVGSDSQTFAASNAVSGSSVFYVAKSGTQSVSWQFIAGGDQSGAITLSNLVWSALVKTTSPSPVKNFVCAGTPDRLQWASVAAADEYRVYLGESLQSLPRLLPDETISGNTVDPCLECSLESDVKYYWRVDSVMYVPGGDDVVVKGDVWPFSIKSWDGPVTELPAFDQTEGLQTTGDGAYRLVEGVRYTLGPLAMSYSCGGCGDGEALPTPVTYTLTGVLPSGLSLIAVNGTNYFTGIAGKTGDYALWVQSHSIVDGVNQIGSTLPVAFSVVGLQKAAGTFNGWVCNADTSKNDGSFVLNVSDAGKITAKIQTPGKAYTFSQTGFDAETNGTVYVRLATPVAAKGVYTTNTLSLALSMTNGAGTGMLTVSGSTPSVSQVTFFRNSWSETNMAAEATAYAGYYTVALPVTAATENAPMGSGYLTLTAAKTGVVRLAGVLADGTSWSSSAALLASQEIEDSGSGVSTNVIVRLLVYAVPSAYHSAGGLCGLLRLVTDATSGEMCAVSDEAMPLHWWNEAGTSVYGYDPESETNGFDTVLGASGGFYDTVMNLQTWYLGRTLTFGAFGGATFAPAGYNGTDDAVSGYTLVDETPEGLMVAVAPQTLTVAKKAVTYVDAQSKVIDFDASVNPCGLTLAYTRATGLMSGGFTLYYQSATPGAAYKTKSCKYKGVLTPMRVMAGAWERTEGQGFYLIPDKTSYSFNWSYRLLLETSAQ